MALTSKIFVTGGTGFVGSYLLRALVKRGYQNVFALYRPRTEQTSLFLRHPSVTWVPGDILDVILLEQYLEGVEVVIHAAAYISYHQRDRQMMYHSNVQGTANVVNAALSTGVKTFLMVSSIAALGGIHKDGTIDEQVEWRDDLYHSHYAWSKYLAELEVHRGFAEGLSGSIVNPGVILGALPWTKGTGQFFSRIHRGLSFYPQGSTGFVDIRDVVQALLLLMERDQQYDRFILVGENLSYHQVFSFIASALNVTAPRWCIHPALLKLAIPYAWVKERLPDHHSTLTVDLLRNTAGTAYYHNQKSKEVLGLTYRSIAESVADTAVIFKQFYPQTGWLPG